MLARTRESGTAELSSVWSTAMAARRPQTTAGIDQTPTPMATYAASIELSVEFTYRLAIRPIAARPIVRVSRQKRCYAPQCLDPIEGCPGQAHNAGSQTACLPNYFALASQEGHTMSHTVYRAIVKAVRSGSLPDPFSQSDFRLACRGLGKGTYQAFFPQTLEGKPRWQQRTFREGRPRSV